MNHLAQKMQALMADPERAHKIDAFVKKLEGGALTTPKRITENLKSFASELVQDQEPSFLAVTPKPWSRMNCCDLNVRKIIQDEGGEEILGYKIWGIDDVYFEAIPHVVWKKTDGEIVDITFNPDGEMKIVFVEAPELQTVRDETMGDKKRGIFDEDLKALWEIENENERNIHIVRPSDQELWATELTYKKWKKSRKKA
ncbi:MAG: hypothetical protein ACI9FZ_000177 [Bacteroidia bacterium]|jgi:hypothetical protein